MSLYARVTTIFRYLSWTNIMLTGRGYVKPHWFFLQIETELPHFHDNLLTHCSSLLAYVYSIGCKFLQKHRLTVRYFWTWASVISKTYRHSTRHKPVHTHTAMLVHKPVCRTKNTGIYDNGGKRGVGAKMKHRAEFSARSLMTCRYGECCATDRGTIPNRWWNGPICWGLRCFQHRVIHWSMHTPFGCGHTSWVKTTPIHDTCMQVLWFARRTLSMNGLESVLSHIT